jgi:hypothetical protein
MRFGFSIHEVKELAISTLLNHVTQKECWDFTTKNVCEIVTNLELNENSD